MISLLTLDTQSELFHRQPLHSPRGDELRAYADVPWVDPVCPALGWRALPNGAWPHVSLPPRPSQFLQAAPPGPDLWSCQAFWPVCFCKGNVQSGGSIEGM